MIPSDLDIRREGRQWMGKEGRERYMLTPEKVELVEGRLFGSDDERITMLAPLLENVGIDRAVGLGPPDIWHDAISGIRRGSD
jgi:hypothetical protein